MPSIYDIKPAFQNLLRPVMHGLHRRGATPNRITAAAIVLSGLGGFMVWCGKTYPAWLIGVPSLLFIRMALNALDGMLARETGQSSPLGEILNEAGDIVSDTVLYLPLLTFFYASPAAVALLALFVLLACLTEFCGVLSKAMTGTRRYDGPMGKSDRAFAISLLALALYFWPGITGQAGAWIFLALDSLLTISCLNRLRYILTASKGKVHA